MTVAVTEPVDPLEKAARWVTRDRTARADVGNEPELIEWLREGPANRAAVEKVADLWNSMGELSADTDIQAVIPRSASANDNHKLGRRVSMAASAALIMGFTYIAWPPAAVAFATGVGERRVVEAPRGIKIELNTASLARVTYGWFSRQVTIEQGDAVVTIDDRLFLSASVAIDGAAVAGEAGRLLIRRQSATVLDGTFTIEGSERPVVRGQALNISANGAPTLVSGVDLDVVTAWQRGNIVFDNVPLGSALAEFERYKPLNYRIAPDAARLRISGTFRTSQGQIFISALPRVHPLTVARGDDGALLIRLKSK